MTEVYILLEDDACTTFSSMHPTGEFVLTEEEAEAWIEDGKGKGWGNYDAIRGYKKVSLKQ